MTKKHMVNRNYSRYEKNYQELYEKYPNKFLIISDEKVKGSFNTLEEAYFFWTKDIGLWKFLLQKCERDLRVLNFQWMYQII